MVEESGGGVGGGLIGSDFQDVFHFDLALGDALVFGDLALHRTFTPKGAHVERRSLEFRLIMPESARLGLDYFDLENVAFVKKGETKTDGDADEVRSVAHV